MRYLRKQVLNRRAPWDQRLYVNLDDAVVMTSTNNVTLPSGTTAQRPVSPVNGMIRYNTDIVTGGEIEVYQASQWRSLRFKEPTLITQQSLGAGDSNNIYFGPLNPAPVTTVQSGITWDVTQMAKHILVVVENVIQLSNTNYTIEQNPPVIIPAQPYTGTLSTAAALGDSTLYFNTSLIATSATGAAGTVTISFIDRPAAVSFAVGSTIIVTGFIPSSYNGTFTVTGTSTNSVSYSNATTTTATFSGTVTSSTAIFTSVDLIGAVASGQASIPVGDYIDSIVVDPNTDALISVTLHNSVGVTAVNSSVTLTKSSYSGSGYYLKFSAPVPLGKIVTVLHGFDK